MLALLFLLATLGQASSSPVFDPPHPLTAWQVAMNGARADVQGATFEMTGRRGWIRTKSIYLDYRFSVEFQLGSPDAAGAVCVRAANDRRDSPQNIGYRIAVRGLATPSESLGQITALTRPLTVVTPATQPVAVDDVWHVLDIDVIRDRITVRVDGLLVSEAEGGELGAGHIGFEHVSGLLRFRNPTVAALRETPWILTRAAGTEVVGLDDEPTPAGVLVPKLVTEVRPRYTAGAIEQKAEGQVRLKVIIDENGHVVHVEVARSLHPELDIEARAAVRRWRFRPATRNGTAVPVWAGVYMDFRLH